MQNRIKNTFPKSLAPIIDIQGVPIDWKECDLKDRVINLFRKMFHTFNSDIVTNVQGIDKYITMLWNMVKTPQNVFGLVGIDGYEYDQKGESDQGMAIHMGIPRLRGRRVVYLDRIYVILESRYDGGSVPYIRFHNSKVENDSNDLNFQYNAIIAAWHPHVSNAQACWGQYEVILHRYHQEGNPFMFLKTLDQFLNTWTRMSPYWNINDQTIDREYHRSSRTTIVVKDSKRINATRDVVGDDRHRQAEIREYIDKNFCKVNSGSPAYDIHFLVSQYERINQLGNANPRQVWKSLKQDLVNQVTSIADDAERGENNDWASWSCFNKYQDGHAVSCRIPSYSNSTETLYAKVTRMDLTHMMKTKLTDKEYREWYYQLIVIKQLAKMCLTIQRRLNGQDFIRDLLADSDMNDEWIRLWARYVNPLEYKVQQLFDKETKQNLAEGLKWQRISYHSSEKYSPEKEDYLTLIRHRKNRVTSMMSSKMSKLIKEGGVKEQVDKLVEDAFHLKYDDPEDYFTSAGRFWGNCQIHRASGQRFDAIHNILNEQYPTSLEEIVLHYRNLKHSILTKENSVLLECYKIVLRRLQENVQINNTEKSTQQVPLVFE